MNRQDAHFWMEQFRDKGKNTKVTRFAEGVQVPSYTYAVEILEPDQNLVTLYNEDEVRAHLARI